MSSARSKAAATGKGARGKGGDAPGADAAGGDKGARRKGMPAAGPKPSGGAGGGGAASPAGGSKRAERGRTRRRSRRTSKLAGSTSRAIAWDLWLRALGGFLAFDVLLACALAAGFVLQCNQDMPDVFFRDELHVVYAPGVEMGFTGLDEGLSSLALTVSAPNGQACSFPVRNGAVFAAVVGGVVVVGELAALANGAFLPRRIRRRLKPLNDLALTAEAMGSATADDPLGGAADLTANKMEALRRAIDTANVNAPNVSTGDADLRSIEVALNGLLRQMQEAKLQQMQFVNDASHELRTPIAVIQGYVNMLDRWGKSDPEVLDESIASLKQESAHMQELVEQLLFLARGDAGRTNMHRERFDVAHVLWEVFEESAMIDPAHGYRLLWQGSVVAESAVGGAHEGVPGAQAPGLGRCDMVGDVALVKQALRILVQNAVKYSPAGTLITLGLQAGGGTVRLTVQDEGIGMSAEELPHAFERFWRADEARQAGAGGTGLGLSIAKWIVDAHDGSVSVVSLEGAGTRFTLEFPAVEG